LLDRIQAYFGVGKVYKAKINAYRYMVRTPKDLAVIIDHFDKYPLITSKRSDFELFKQVVDIINRKQHLSFEGLQQIVNLRASINNGLSQKLKEAFPDTIPVQRPIVKDQVIKDPNWLAGFTNGEGCFHVSIFKSSTKLGEAVRLEFIITQHYRDEQLMRSLIEYFDCGNLSKDREVFHYRVGKFSDIENKIIPFYEIYPLLGQKGLDYADFCKVAELMKSKAHFTASGLEKIIKIKAGMNRGR